MDWTRSAIGSALGAGAPGWDPGAVVAAPVPPPPSAPRPVLWVWQSSWPGH